VIAGFLAGSAVKRNGALNAGLRKVVDFLEILILIGLLVDQDFALRWVNQHVRVFFLAFTRFFR
jgi:hypothetical protein